MSDVLLDISTALADILALMEREQAREKPEAVINVAAPVVHSPITLPAPIVNVPVTVSPNPTPAQLVQPMALGWDFEVVYNDNHRIRTVKARRVK